MQEQGLVEGETEISFTFVEPDREITVLTVKEDKEQGLRLLLRSPDTLSALDDYADGPDLSAFAGQRIKESRYSIHASDESVNGINLIKRTLRLFGGVEPITSVHLTKAIKTANQFAPIYTRRVGELGEAHKYKPGKGRLIRLGAYDPNKFTAFFMVVISSPERSLNNLRPRTTSVFEYNFTRFKITVVVTYLPIPTLKKGHLFHLVTINPDLAVNEEEKAAALAAIDGFDDLEVMDLFAHMARAAEDILIDDVARGGGPPRDSSFWQAVLRTGLYKEADQSEYLSRLAQVMGYDPPS
ncbi:hypothetical protein OSH11_17225 [Kaistia dalseonensis]|uniref:Uncharacterized protein n=1 Tax=Kaistia dalseonensis TaxID=410840 RepID=A0ABU0H9S7_9HYPH|nr:hypothetical protein [Kaistia dalseonensis]MCX5496452.1 hypothetical protein [Kaistia dalseonensis]MDQ0439073.1 hypothetical protein [Kaistia dalseonensis]